MSREHPLKMLDSCDHCAACCMRTPVPPFGPAEEIRRDVPAALMEPIYARIKADQQFDLLPCVWLDLTTRRCQHYELRPDACRDFQINSDLCRLSRWDEGLD